MPDNRRFVSVFWSAWACSRRKAISTLPFWLRACAHGVFGRAAV